MASTVLISLAQHFLSRVVNWRKGLIVGGLLLAVLGVVLAVVLSNVAAPEDSAPREVVVKLDPSESGEPTIIQPIILDSGSGGGPGIWLSVLTALGGLMGGLGTLAAVWVKADQGQVMTAYAGDIASSADIGQTRPSRAPQEDT